MANEEVKKAIKRAGITQAEYSEICGISFATFRTRLMTTLPDDVQVAMIDELTRFRHDEEVNFRAYKEWLDSKRRIAKDKSERHKSSLYSKRIELELAYYEQRAKDMREW